MILSANNHVYHLLRYSLVLDGLNGVDKIQTLVGHISTVAQGLVDRPADVITSGPITVYGDGLPVCQETLIADGEFTYSTDTSVKVSRKGDLNTEGVPSAITADCVCTAIAKAIMVTIDIINLTRYTTKKGISLSGKMLSQKQSAERELNRILDLPIMLANSAELAIYADSSNLLMTLPIRDPGSLSSVRLIKGKNTALAATIEANRQQVEQDVVTTTPLSAADVPNELRTYGMWGWYYDAGYSVEISRNAPAIIELDQITRDLVSKDASALLGLLPLYLRSFFTGKADVVAKVGSETFIRDAKKLGLNISNSQWGTIDIMDYLATVGISKPAIVSLALLVDDYLRSGVISASVESISGTDSVAQYLPWIHLPFYEWPADLQGESLTKSGDTLVNSQIRISFSNDSSLSIQSLMDGYRGSNADKQEIVAARTHVDTILALLKSVSYMDNDVVWLKNINATVSDVASYLNKVGIRFALAKDVVFVEGGYE